jgi:hypothetical protein
MAAWCLTNGGTKKHYCGLLKRVQAILRVEGRLRALRAQQVGNSDQATPCYCSDTQSNKHYTLFLPESVLNAELTSLRTLPKLGFERTRQRQSSCALDHEGVKDIFNAVPALSSVYWSPDHLAGCQNMLGGTHIGLLQGQQRPICTETHRNGAQLPHITRSTQHAARRRRRCSRAAAESGTAGTSIVEPVQPEHPGTADAPEHKAQQAATAAAPAGGQPDITIAISPAAEQEIQRALLAENGAQAALLYS